MGRARIFSCSMSLIPLFIFSLCNPLCFAFSESSALALRILNLGPYDLDTRFLEQWVMEGSPENHWVSFYDKKQPAAMVIAFEVVTEYQRRLKGARPILLFSHQQWLDFLKTEKRGIRIVSASTEFKSEGELHAMIKGIDQGRHFESHRFYRLSDERGLILIFTLEVGASIDSSRIKSEFMNLVSHTRWNQDYELSPCVRVGIMGRQFLRFVESRRALKKEDEIEVYQTSLRQELETMLKEHAHHGWSIHYLLGYLACFNPKGEMLGEGSDRRRALACFRQSLRENPEASDAQEAIQTLLAS